MADGLGRRGEGPVTLEAGAQRRRGRLSGEPSPAGKADLVNAVARALSTSRADAEIIVDEVGMCICELACKHLIVRVPHLGNFRVLETEPRMGRNPRTGEDVPIAPGKRLTFRAAKSFKTSINKRRRSIP